MGGSDESCIAGFFLVHKKKMTFCHLLMAGLTKFGHNVNLCPLKHIGRDFRKFFI